MAVAHSPAASAHPDVTPEQLIQRAVELRPRLVDAQADTERRRYYSPELHQAFLDAGFYKMWVPRRYGGYEVDLLTYCRVLVELARGCMSAAWCLGLCAGHALQVGSYFNREAQDEVFGDGEFRCASVAAPTMLAAHADGGWELNGQVAYCSGIPYSTYFLGQALIDGLPPQQQQENMLLYLAPKGVWEMLDDWGETTGLKGSGSHSIRITEGRIPDHFVVERTALINVDVSDRTPGFELHGNPLYCGRTFGVFTLELGALMVGAGLGALDEFEHHMRNKTTPLPPPAPRLADPDFQRWYGAAYARLLTAEAAMRRGAEEHMELCERTAAGGQPYSEEDDQRVAAIGRELMIQAWEATEELLLRNVGASVMKQDSRFERIYRDMTTGAAHRNTSFRDPLHRRLAELHLGIG